MKLSRQRVLIAGGSLIALNRENPMAVDERFLGKKAALERAVKDHSAL